MKITSIEQVRSALGEPSPAAGKKIYSHLHPGMVEFIRHSPLAFISTVDQDGFPTVSPKGDQAGFIDVQDPHHLLVPERKGNKLAFSLLNILDGSRIGLLFLVPGTHEVLRVQGSAEIIADPELNDRLSSTTQKALLVTRVTVSSCYFHCGKALMRSNLWAAEAARTHLRISFGEEIAGNDGLASSSIAEIDAGVDGRYITDI